MANVIGIRFENAGKLYFFDPAGCDPAPGEYVIVETVRGMEVGEVVTSVQQLEDALLTEPLKPVLRIADDRDLQHEQDNKVQEKEAFGICQQKIEEHKLDMKLVSAKYTFDNSKILFYFTANGRVDFRALVKDLAAAFHTRIELRQIGVRDEAKMLGGLGPCGRPICCRSFLGDFQPVSIKMAKEQNLSLNPTKISGVCGRLMCCLKYEEDTYEEIRHRMPKVGREVLTPDGPGTVWELNIIRESVRVRIQKGDSSELKDYPLTDIQTSSNSNGRFEKAAAPQPVPGEDESKPDEQEPEESNVPAAERQLEEGTDKLPKPESKRRRPQKEARTAQRDKAAAQPAVRQETAQSASQEPAAESAEKKAFVAKPVPRKNTANWKQAVAQALDAAKAHENEVSDT